MSKLLITADVHGSLGSWLALKELLDPQDALAVAGDLFDTRYGSYSRPDFKPEAIKQDIEQSFGNRLYYVYGNCDVASFFKPAQNTLSFDYQDTRIFMHHGHVRPQIPQGTDLVIQGHTHHCFMEEYEGMIFLNPGSISLPKNGLPTYAEMDQGQIKIKALKTGETIKQMTLA